MPATDASKPAMTAERARLNRWDLVLAVFAGLIGPLMTALLLLWLVPVFQERLLERPSCDNPRDLHLVQGLSAESESVLPADTASYEAQLAVDGDSGTSWVEGELGDDNPYGRGEVLEITLPETRDVRLVCIINGYAKDPELFARNARIRQLTVTTEQGSKESVLPEKTGADYAAYQPLQLQEGRTATLSIEIGTVRAGQGQDRFTDTAVSEVEIWAADERPRSPTPSSAP